MTDNQTFKNLGKFMSSEEVTKSGLELIVVSYTQPKYRDPKKRWDMGIPINKISDELLEKIANASSGEEYCMHTVKNEKGFSELVDITDAKDAQMEKKAWGGGGGKAPYDGDGAQIGNALNNAAIILGVGKSVAELKTTAWEIIIVGEELKKDLAALRKSSPTAKIEVETKAEVKKPLTKLQQMKAKAGKNPEVKQALEEDTLEEDFYDDDIGDLA